MSRATVFGLDVRTDRPLSFLQGSRAEATGRELELELVDGGPEALGWTPAELISDERHPDGSVNFQIERSASEGYRIWGPSYGASVISADGRALRGAVGEGGMAAWQRLLVAQALPFAAVLRGLEVLHASAVVLDGAAAAFVGPSGAGKSTLAFALCARGASFLADDVLAVERREEALICHPGSPAAGIEASEADRLAGVGALEGHDLLGRDGRERVVSMSPVQATAPLRALFFLERSESGPRQPSFEVAADAQMLLAATFNLVLGGASRLERLLDVCATAARGRVERIACGPETGAAELAAAVEPRIREPG